ncbi:MAG: PKD domain-containing protein [Bacteroidia bacterium]|nr:PKD domain-containing protein [Bacteroidia bacterium]
MRKNYLLLLILLLTFAQAWSQCTGVDNLGSASNMFTIIQTEANPIAVNNDINTMIFVHRNNAGTFGGHSGQFRYDITTNGGTSWTLDQGPLNPASVNGTNAGRYPNIAIYNPSGNQNPSNAYLTYLGATVASTWNGEVTGVRKLNGTGNTENYNQFGVTQSLIPRSMVKGAPGVYWAIDAIYNGTAATGFRIFKGTWNQTNNTISWTLNKTINPGFNTGFDGSNYISDFQLAFDPTGQIGWACALTHLTPGPTGYAFYPVFYKTSDGGATWSTPIQVDLGQFSCLTSNMATGNIPTTIFDMDLTVDVYGNPHCITGVGNGSGSYSIYFGEWHAIFDITQMDGIWIPIHIRDIYKGRGSWGSGANVVSMDMDCQAARSDDGTHIFAAWGDADSVVASGVAGVSPDLYVAAYDVVNRVWTPAENVTSCNTTWKNKILFPRMAPTVLNAGVNWRLPVVFGALNTGTSDPIDPATFHYLNNIQITPSDFTVPQCTAAVSLSNLDTIIVCDQSSYMLDAGSGKDQYLWNNASTNQTLTVTSSGTYSVAVRSGCCTGTDQVVVIFKNTPNSAFNGIVSGLAVAFNDQTSGTPLTWHWDFGDGNTSTQQNPSHTYAVNGVYTVCLITSNGCGADTSCSNITTNCTPATAAWSFSVNGLSATFTDQTVGSPVSWVWNFGDGNFSTNQNPTHNYASNGTYNVCLITTDACGNDTLCQMVTICPDPVASFSVTTAQDMATFTDQSTGNTLGWAWDFGDGNTSTQQNPTHQYTTSGSFTVCLTVTDTCGNDSSCQTVVIIIEGVNEGFSQDLVVYPNPTHDFVHLKGIHPAAGTLQIRLSDLQGRIVLSREVQHPGGPLDLQLDLRTLADQQYILQLSNGQQSWSQLVGKTH